MDIRYEFIRPLGSGGQGQVSLVRDRARDGQEVALKRVAAASDVEILRREFSVLTGLRHPSLARAYDFGCDDEGCFFTSEFVEGVDLVTWARRTPLHDVCRGLASLLRALCLLHSRDLVHGDLSPANVLVPAHLGAQPKLLDLGSARAPGVPSDAATAGYAAPELYSGRGVLLSSDLYSFGAILAECLLGGPAFGCGDASQIVTRQLKGELALPGEADSSVALLCRDLLAVDPAARPATALEVISRLSDATQIELVASLGELRAQDLPEPALVGRDPERLAMALALDHVDEPESDRVLSLVGPPGSGRSTLLATLVRLAQLSGFAVIGRPGSALTIRELYSALLELSQGAGGVTTAREALTSFLSGHHPPGDAGQLELLAAEVFKAAGDARPLLVVFDDLDESAASVQRIAAVLVRAMDPERFDERPRALIAAAGCSADRVMLAHAQRHELGPLPRDAVEAVVRSMLPGITVDPALIDIVVALSDGWPGRAEVLVRLAAEQRGDLSELSGNLWQSLEPSDLALLEALAGARRPLPLVAVRRAAGDARVETLQRRGLLVESTSPEGVDLRPMAAPLTRNGAPEAEVISMAKALATELEAMGDLGSSARLWTLGNEHKRALSLFLAESQREHQRGDLLSCASWLDEAVALGGEEPAPWVGTAVEVYRRLGRHPDALALVDRLEVSQPQRRLTRIELLLDSGCHREALQAAEQARAEEDSESLRAAAAAALVHMGQPEQALGMANAALSESVGDSTPSSASGRLSLVAALSCTTLGRLDEASRFLSRAARAFESVADVLGQLKVVAAMGQLAWRRGEFSQARAAFDRAIILSDELGDTGRQALYLSNRAAMAQTQDDYAAAFSDYGKALAMTTLLGNEALRTSVEVNLADLLVELGQPRQAERLALLATQRSRATHQARYELQAALVRGKALLRAGEWVRAEAVFLDVRRRFAAAGEEDFRLTANVRLAELYLLRGHAKGARDLAHRTEQQAAARRLTKERVRALVLEARAMLALGGMPREALALLEQAASEPLGDDEKWRLQWHMATAHEAAGDPAPAIDARARARLGLARMLSRVPPDMQESFLGSGEALEVEPRGRVDELLATTDRWARDLELLMEINLELTRELDTKRLLRLIMERAVELTGAERGMVILPRGGKLEPVVSHQIADEVEVSFSRSVAEKVVAEGRPTLAVDAMDDDRFRTFASVNTMKLRSILAVPLAIRKRVIGVIYLDSRLRSGVFGEADRRLLEAFGAQAAVALETARLVAESGRRLEDLERANAEVLSLSHKLEEKLERKESDLQRVGVLLKQTQAAGAKAPDLGIIGRSEAMQALRRLVERVAPADVPVTIFGPSGTGKELVARAVHHCSERADQPFVAVNCGALPSKLLGSELFGHVKGAFTGAMHNRKGLFELADGGVLLLDEVGDMDPEMQTHLLRVLQDGKFRRIGSNDEIVVDVRILSASNKDLAAEVAAGRFREDLFYRLNVVGIEVPCLNDRRDDIPLLIEHFLEKYATKGRHLSISKQAMDLFLAAEWPGNVRELENEVQRAIAMSTAGQPIVPEDLSPRFQTQGREPAVMGKGQLKDRVDAFEKVVIERVLDECKGNATKAAKSLGLSRAGLYKKLGKHQVER